MHSRRSLAGGLLALLVTPGFASPEERVGTGVDFTITNATSRAIEVQFDTRWNCIEPDLTPAFIGKTFPLEPGESWSKKIWRRNGHGCNGENAEFWARPVIGGRALGWTHFFITGDGGVGMHERSPDYPSLFHQGTGRGGSEASPFTWRIFDSDPVTEVSDADKLALLEAHAPKIWLAEGENYYPSSLEWAFPMMARVHRHDRFWLYAKQELSSPSDNSLPLFAGELSTAPVYAFWVDGKAGGVTDLVYFNWYPYNRGKELAGTVWGNHVGDWENVVVRLDANLQPQRVFLSQHSGDQNVPWGELEKVDGYPVVYAAEGSHGLWPTTGDHVYQETPLGDLVDSTSAGKPWETWERVVAFDYRARKGLGGAAWPRWMDRNYVVSLSADPGDEDPASGPIYRWGNGENGCGGALGAFKSVAGECRLNDGPTGPLDKGDRWDRDGIMIGAVDDSTPVWRAKVD